MKHPLNNLITTNKGIGSFYAETTGDETTIFLYDIIVSDDSWEGVSPLTFNKELLSISSPVIHLRLDSPGGEVFASVAMAQAMREHSSKIIVHVDGYAASAATQLLMAADESVISPGGMVMIHKAWTFAAGNSDDFASTAELLSKIDGQIVESYANKTGKDPSDLVAMMAAETWMTEKEAVAMGFVDAIAEGNPDKQNRAEWNLSAYTKPPKAEEPTKEPIDNNTPVETVEEFEQFDAHAHAVRMMEITLIEGAV